MYLFYLFRNIYYLIINKLYESLSSHLNEVNASTSEMHVPEGLNEELATMKNKVASLNAKYKGMLSAMNN